MADFHHRSLRMTDETWARLGRAYHAAAQASPAPLSKTAWLERVLDAGIRAHTPAAALAQVLNVPAPAAAAPLPPSAPPSSPPTNIPPESSGQPPRQDHRPSRAERQEKAMERLRQRTPPPIRPPAIATATSVEQPVAEDMAS